jgi:hypothetical protein
MVNRNTSATTVTVSLPNFTISNGSYQVLTLSNLPADNTTITFKSHTDNALKSSTVTVTSNAFSLSLPAYSITSVILKSVPKADPTITWANPASIVYGTALSATQLNATASVAGTFVYTPASGTKPNAGTQTLSVTFTPTDGATYNTLSKTVSIVVNKATPVITWANPANIVYGAALSAAQLNATASVAGTFVYLPASGTKPNAGTQTLSVTFSPTDGTNYSAVTKTASIIVSKATPVITWNNPADITAGTALTATQLNATASVAGTFVYNPISGTKLNAGSGQSLSVTFTPTDATNYNSATKSVVINVLNTTKTDPVITWTTPADITLGTALSATQLNATANISGTFVYNPTAGTKLNAGNAQTLSVTFTPTDATTYNSATKTVKINVLSTTGFGSPQKDKVACYPNPAKEVLYFQNIPINTYVSIIDLNGKLLINKKVENNQIHIGNLPQGVYCVKLITGSEVSILKLIKE